MTDAPLTFAVIGAGPAGLMAAEHLAGFGRVTVLDRMPSAGRKLLMAGRGGLNLTHSEPLERLLDHYGAARARLAPAITAFSPTDLIAWCEGLGQPTFVGSSGRVFPRAMKASPLLRAWLARLNAAGVTLRTRQSWQGFTPEGALAFTGPDGDWSLAPDAAVLALGGASWPRLGADGDWTRFLPDSDLRPLRPANMGFEVAWSDVFRTRFAGQPLKRIGLSFGGQTVPGEAMVTERGLEGGAVYALSAALRDAIAAKGPVTLRIDLRPDLTVAALSARLPADRGSQSLSNQLRKAGLSPVAIGLVQEALHAGPAPSLAELVKAVPVRLLAPAPIARAISTAGGLAWEALDAHFMLRDRPGLFAAGEMLDWEAPTGGYLLQACFSTGLSAARGAVRYAKAALTGLGQAGLGQTGLGQTGLGPV